PREPARAGSGAGGSRRREPAVHPDGAAPSRVRLRAAGGRVRARRWNRTSQPPARPLRDGEAEDARLRARAVPPRSAGGGLSAPDTAPRPDRREVAGRGLEPRRGIGVTLFAWTGKSSSSTASVPRSV